MEKPVKMKKHGVLKHPILAMFLLMGFGFGCTFIANWAGPLVAKIAANFNSDEAALALISDNAKSCAIIIVGILLLLIHKLWFRPEFKGNLSTAFFSQRQAVLCMVIFFVLDAGMIAAQYIACGFGGFTVNVLLTALCAGFAEEVICRGLVISTMMRKYKDTGRFWPALILPAVLFGLAHIVVALSGKGILSAIPTIASAAVAGLFFAALYLRTGSVLPSAILHFLHDLLAMMVADSDKGETVSAVTYFALLAVMLVLTFILIKGHKEDILSVWKERWGSVEAPEEASKETPAA